MACSRDFRAWYKMASGSVVSEVMLEEKLVELWPEYSCLYDVRSSDFKNRNRREVAMLEISEDRTL